MKKKYTLLTPIVESTYFQMILVKIHFSIFSRFIAIFPAARDPNFQAEEEDISTFKQHAL